MVVARNLKPPSLYYLQTLCLVPHTALISPEMTNSPLAMMQKIHFSLDEWTVYGTFQLESNGVKSVMSFGSILKLKLFILVQEL